MHKPSAMPAEERERTIGETCVRSPSAVSLQEKREAVEEVLGSQRFSRAEQLRNFLRYICEMELTGRGRELCETLIGVEALGRPANYTPAEDASVRRRASDLRDKLQDVYDTELASSKVRIEIPKGKYVPRFVRVQPENAVDAALVSSAQSRGPVELALSHSNVRHVIATSPDFRTMEAAQYKAPTSWRRHLTIWLSVGWLLGALTVAGGFTLARWLWPAPSEAATRANAYLPVSPLVAAEPGTSYEAEATGNILHRAAKAYGCDWCSGGARVRYIGHNPGNYLVINNINVRRADDYEMLIFYVVEGTRTLFFRVNDGPVRKMVLSGKSWSEVAKISVNVHLTSGNNNVKFYNDLGHAPDIDRIVIR